MKEKKVAMWTAGHEHPGGGNSMCKGPLMCWRKGEKLQCVAKNIPIRRRAGEDQCWRGRQGLDLWFPRKMILPWVHFGRLLECKCAQSCLTLCDPMDCSLPGSSVHGISQARMLEWVAISDTRVSSPPWDWTCVSCVFCIGRWILCHYTTWEAICWGRGVPYMQRVGTKGARVQSVHPTVLRKDALAWVLQALGCSARYSCR